MSREHPPRARAADVPTVAIVGLGLIGGSLARALVLRGVRVLGVTRDPQDAELAAHAGVAVLADLHALSAAVPRDGTVVLATPLSVLGGVADAVVAQLPAECGVVHVAGLQRAAATGFGAAARARVLGTHPLAGSHETGFAAGRADLFAGANLWIEARADAAARARAEWLWAQAGVGTITYATAEEHDAQVAWVSHLPQLAAIALAGALAESGVPAQQGGPGLRDATRLAASPFPLWRDLLAAAPPETGAALRALAVSIDRLGAAFARGDTRALESQWETARAWRVAPTTSDLAMTDHHPTSQEDVVLDMPTTASGGPRW